MPGTFDQPELSLPPPACLRFFEKGLGHGRPYIGVLLPVDHQEWLVPERGDGLFQWREIAVSLPRHPPERDDADGAVENIGQYLLEPGEATVDLHPMTHVGNNRGVDGKHPVGDAATNSPVAGCRHHSGPGPLAEPDQGDTPWIGVRSPAGVTNHSQRVLNLMPADPMQREVSRNLVALALAPGFPRKHIVAGLAQELGVILAGPTVRPELDAEKDDPLAGPLGKPGKVAGAQLLATDGLHHQILGVPGGRAPGYGENRPFLEDAGNVVEIFKNNYHPKYQRNCREKTQDDSDGRQEDGDPVQVSGPGSRFQPV